MGYGNIADSHIVSADKKFYFSEKKIPRDLKRYLPLVYLNLGSNVVKVIKKTWEQLTSIHYACFYIFILHLFLG